VECASQVLSSEFLTPKGINGCETDALSDIEMDANPQKGTVKANVETVLPLPQARNAQVPCS